MTFVDRLPDKSVYKVGRKGKVRLFVSRTCGGGDAKRGESSM